MNSSPSKAFLLYVVAFAVAGVTPFMLLPVLTKTLSPSDFGEATAFIIWTTLLASVAGLCTHGFVSVRFFKVKAEQFRVLVSSSIATVALAHLMAAILVAAFSNQLASIFDLSIGFSLLAVIASFFLSVNLLLLTVLQVTANPRLYLHVRILQALIELLLCVALIYLITADAGARIYSYTLALFASFVLAVIYAKHLGCVGLTVGLMDSKALLKFSGPLMPHIVAGTLISSLDRLVVSAKLGAESLGIYMVAMQIGMAMIILIDPLNKALMPWLFEQLKTNNHCVKRMVVIKTYQLYVLLAAFGIMLSLMAYYLFEKVIDTQYSSARPLIPWFVAGFVMQGMYYTQVNYLFYAERTGRLSLITVSVAIVGALVSWQMTSFYALQGAALSFFVNNCLLFLLVWIASSKVVSMPWGLR